MYLYAYTYAPAAEGRHRCAFAAPSGPRGIPGVSLDPVCESTIDDESARPRPPQIFKRPLDRTAAHFGTVN